MKLRVDWTCHETYGDRVVVELHVMGEPVRTISTEATVARAIDRALRWLDARGFDYSCNIDWHQQLGHRHVTLHPVPKKGETSA